MTVHATPRQATAACVCRFSFLPNLTDATNATNAHHATKHIHFFFFCC